MVLGDVWNVRACMFSSDTCVLANVGPDSVGAFLDLRSPFAAVMSLCFFKLPLLSGMRKGKL